MMGVMNLRLGVQVACVVMLLLAGPATAQQGDADNRNTALQSALAEMDLSAEQRLQLKGVFERVREQSAAADALRRDDPAAARRKRRALAGELRDEIARILTPDQQETLRQRMQRQPETAPSPPPPSPPPATPRSARPPAPPPPDAMRDTPPAETSVISAEPTPNSSAVPPRFARAGNPLPVGSDAPPISLTDLKGRRLTLDNLPRRPIVLIFGSYSCPAFRQQAARLNQLAEAHTRRAHFLIVYTREAHAVGEWEVQRNRDEDIRVAQHANAEARKSVATAAQRALNITLPIALDDMDNTTVRNYDAFPNGAVILSADRKVLAAQRWVDPFLLDEVLMGLER